jgi:hypothetical protein
VPPEKKAMKLDSVRELKANLGESVVEPLATSVAARAVLGIAARPMAAASAVPPTFALGVTRRGQSDYALAVRVQKRILEQSSYVESIRKKAKGEVDIRYVGAVSKRSIAPVFERPREQQRTRPLTIGLSVGHIRITAGTLGCFVKSLSGEDRLILSNNHVLANENRARRGDLILQPGPFDRGAVPDDKVATLTRWVSLKKRGANLVDAAVATLAEGIAFDPASLAGIRGKLTGLGESFVDEDTPVAKVGRTTGTTRGRVVTFELDNLMVAFDGGAIRFDDQIEIEATGRGPFSQGGDSGSLIVDGSRKAVALLFAGSDQGGSNGQGLTYANPIHTVLKALKIELIS